MGGRGVLGEPSSLGRGWTWGGLAQGLGIRLFAFGEGGGGATVVHTSPNLAHRTQGSRRCWSPVLDLSATVKGTYDMSLKIFCLRLLLCALSSSSFCARLCTRICYPYQGVGGGSRKGAPRDPPPPA